MDQVVSRSATSQNAFSKDETERLCVSLNAVCNVQAFRPRRCHVVRSAEVPQRAGNANRSLSRVVIASCIPTERTEKKLVGAGPGSSALGFDPTPALSTVVGKTLTAACKGRLERHCKRSLRKEAGKNFIIVAFPCRWEARQGPTQPLRFLVSLMPTFHEVRG
jgi:hypothetical protein